MAGPTDRAMLNPIEFSATAPGRAVRGTMSPTAACHAGLFSAVPQAMAKVKPSNPQGVSQSFQAKNASSSDTATM